MHKILIVGQTPPPHHGQAIMIERILQQKYSKVHLTHLRMNFSTNVDDIGIVQLKKIWHLILLIIRIYTTRIKEHTTVLYYPPAGPNKVPMYRDFLILICTRWLFKKTIFHFHAGGISELYLNLSRFEKFLFRAAYYNPDGTILLSELNPRDDLGLHSRKNFVIPYGIEDHYPTTPKLKENDAPTILFVGLLKESKGVLILLEALSTLKSSGVKFNAVAMGKFESADFERTTNQLIKQYNLVSEIKFTGVLTGDEKWRQFSKSDIFCFPTFYESETFGLVVLEAMQFGIPVIVSNWRGVPSMVNNGKTGFIVPVKDPKTVADKLALLCNDKKLATQMGVNGRKKYLQEYSVSTFRDNIENAFVQVSESQHSS